MNTLRAEVEALEKRYKKQMKALKNEVLHGETESRRPTLQSEDDGVLRSNPQTLARDRCRRQLQQLVTTHDELKSEHRVLQDLHDRHAKFQCRVQLLVDSERASYDEMCGSRIEERRARVLQELRARSPVQMKRPLSVDECYDIGREVYAKIVTFTESENCASSGGAVCGWVDQRRVDDGLLKFSLQKVFPNITTHEIAARTWPVLASPSKLQTFYSANMKMHCEVAQKVDENNVVIYQEYQAKEKDPVTGHETETIVLVRSVLLITLFEIENGYVMVFYGLDPDRLMERDEKDLLASVGITDRKVWLDKFSWCIWQEDGHNAKNVNGAFVGAVPAHGASSRYWSVEVLLLSLRWEREVIGPNFILRGEGNPEPSDRDELMAAEEGGSGVQTAEHPPSAQNSHRAETGNGSQAGSSMTTASPNCW